MFDFNIRLTDVLKLMKKYLYIYLVILIIPLILCVIWFHNGYILGSGESALPFYNLMHEAQSYSSSWNGEMLGEANETTIAGGLTYSLSSYLEIFGLSNSLIEAVFFSFVLMISGMSVFLLTKEIFPRLENKYYILSILFYWFNPISLVNIWNRFLYNYIEFYAFLPLATFLYLRGIKNRKYYYSLLIGVTTVLFSYSLTAIPFDLVLWLIFAYISLFYLIQDVKNKWFILKYIILTASIFILVNFWWISQLFSFVYAGTYTSSVGSFFTNEGNLAGLSVLSKELGQFNNTFRFMHAMFFSGNLSWANIYNFPLLEIIEFCISGIIFWTILKFKTNKDVLFLAILFFATLFLMKGNEVPFGEIFQTLFLKFTAFQVFRNPFEKFGFLLPLAASPLYIYGVANIYKLISNLRIRILFLVANIVVIGLMWSFPFWTGLVFTDGSTTTARNYQVDVPSYYKNANNWLTSQGNDFRFISLPIGGEGMTYTWDKSYSGVELSSTLFDTPNISFNTTVPFYQDIASLLNQYQLSDQILNFMPFVNGKYIVWRDDIDYKDRLLPNPDVTKAKLDTWVRQGLLTERFHQGQLTIYQVKPNYFWPEIYTTSNIFLTNNKDLSLLSKFDPSFPNNKVAFVNLDDTSEKIVNESFILSPQETFSPQITSSTINYSDQDLLARLTYAQHLPGEMIYPLIRLKEILETPSKNNYSSWLLYENSILEKRAVEVYLLRLHHTNTQIISRAENDYMTTLNKLKSEFVNNIHDNSPISEVIKQSLYYQSLLLSRSNSAIASSLDDVLASLELKAKYFLPRISTGRYLVYRFQVPKQAYYNISGISQFASTKVYLDGDLLTDNELKKNSNMNAFDLTFGTHEVAVATSDPEVTQVVREQNIQLNNLVRKDWSIDESDQSTNYQISFDYKFSVGKIFNIQFSQQDDKVPSYETQVIQSSNTNDWKHWQGNFSSRMGFGKGNLIISVAKKEVCKEVLLWESCTLLKQPYQVELRNFTIIKQEDTPTVTLVSPTISSKTNSKNNASIQWNKVSPTLYTVKVNKVNDEPELLVMSQSFDPRWEAFYSDGTNIPSDKHFLVNDFANAWLINKKGNYELSIQFTPQKLLNIGEWISLVSFVICLMGIGGYTLWEKRKRH